MSQASAVRLGFGRAERTFLGVVSVLVGGVLGVVVPYAARWAEDRGVPFPGPLALIGSLDDPWAVWGRPVLGLLAGAAFVGQGYPWESD